MARKNIYRNGYDLQPISKNYKPIALLAIILIIGVSLFATFVVFNDNTDQQIVEVENLEPVKPPYDFSSIVFIPEGQSAVGTLDFGLIRTSSETEKPAPIASITKIITALAILEKAPLDLGEQGDIITLNSKDEQYYHDYLAIDGVVTPVTAGLQMSQYAVVHARLLPSSNNMTDTLVDRYFNSREEYLDYANNMLVEFGLKNTRVADASGFSPESVSIPSELITIAQRALKNPLIAEIVAQPSAKVSVAGDIKNYNILINEPNVNGIKPGATDEAGSCLLFSAKVNNSTGKEEVLIGVVMGVFNRNNYFNGTKKLLNDTTKLISLQ